MKQTISVIIPTFQHAHTLVRCLDSVLVQTRKPDEIIVVNDGSFDYTAKVLHRYQNDLNVITQENRGAPHARNRGFDASTGSLIIFCDADVIMNPCMLETLERALEAHPNASYAYSSFLWGWKRFRSFSFDRARLRHMNYIHTTALLRRSVFPRFDESLKRFQDWDLWLTLLEQGRTGVFVDHMLFHVLQDQNPLRMSRWLPSGFFRIPWNWIGWQPKRVKAYEQAKSIITQKHSL